MPHYAPHNKPLSPLWILAGSAVILFVIALIVAPGWTCAPFHLSDLSDPGELPPPLPPDCVATNDEPSADTVQALENKRQQMGLELKETTTCIVPTAKAKHLDPQWLPKMYVGGLLRYRRHVLLAAKQDGVSGTVFVVERCLTPWWKYIDEAGTSCWGQFEFWK